MTRNNSNPKRKPTQIILILLLAVSLVTVLLIIGAKIAGIRLFNSSPTDGQLAMDRNVQELSNSADVQAIQTLKVQPDYTGWKSVADPRGFAIKIPNDWFIAVFSEELPDYSGQIQQVQNWDPKTARYGVLEGDMSKWDVYFTKEPFTSEEAILKQKSEDMTVERIERSTAEGGQTVYFIQGYASMPWDEQAQVPRIVAIIVDDGNYYAWYSIYSGAESDSQILKAIVLSIN